MNTFANEWHTAEHDNTTQTRNLAIQEDASITVHSYRGAILWYLWADGDEQVAGGGGSWEEAKGRAENAARKWVTAQA